MQYGEGFLSIGGVRVYTEDCSSPDDDVGSESGDSTGLDLSEEEEEREGQSSDQSSDDVDGDDGDDDYETLRRWSKIAWKGSGEAAS